MIAPAATPGHAWTTLESEATAAVREGIDWPSAVRLSEFAHLAQVHVGVSDALLSELPTSAAHTAQRTFGSVLANDAERVLTQAATHAGARDHALAGFFGFETIRAGVLAHALRDPSLERQGTSELDIDAASHVALAHLHNDCDRPLRIATFMALGLLHMHPLAQPDELSAATHVKAASHHALRTELRRLRMPERLLLANACAPLWDEPRLSLDALRTQHALALGEQRRDTKDKRLSRARKTLNERGAGGLQRTGKNLVDLLDEADKDGPV